MSNNKTVGSDRNQNQFDCLDATFDKMEGYACTERTGEIFPTIERPPSPILRYDVYDKKAQSSGMEQFEQISNSSDYDASGGCCANDRGVGFIAGAIGGLLVGRGDQPESSTDDPPKGDVATTADNSLSTTLTAPDSDSRLSQNIHINRQNSLLDVESPGEIEKNKEDRMEQLRQNKRAIEKERLNLSQNQNQKIVIPRSSLYGSEEEDIEDPKSHASNSKLQVGSSVSKKQADRFYFRKRIALIGTIFLISIGVIVAAAALFWPDKEL